MNTTVKFPFDGIVQYSDVTSYRSDSILMWAPVVRTLCKIRRKFRRTVFQLGFDPNDQRLWDDIISALNPYLRQLKRDRGLSDHFVQCDDTLNTPESILRAEVQIKVHVEFVPAGERFIITYVAHKKGQIQETIGQALAA